MIFKEKFGDKLIYAQGTKSFITELKEGGLAVTEEYNPNVCAVLVAFDTELTAAKRSLINSYRQIYDNPFDMHAFYSARSAFGVDTSLEACCKKIEALTREDVLRVAGGIELDTTYFLSGTAEGEEDDDE